MLENFNTSEAITVSSVVQEGDEREAHRILALETNMEKYSASMRLSDTNRALLPYCTKGFDNSFAVDLQTRGR